MNRLRQLTQLTLDFDHRIGGCPTLLETCWMVSWGKQPRAMDCLMMEKAALIMAWLAMQAAAVANTNTNCRQQKRSQI